MSRQTITAVLASAVLSSGFSVTLIEALNPPTATGLPQAVASVNVGTKTVSALNGIQVTSNEELKALKKLNTTLLNGFADLRGQAAATNTKLDAADTKLGAVAASTDAVRGDLSSNFSDVLQKDGANAYTELHFICQAVRQSNSC
jgi:hypothetical protein